MKTNDFFNALLDKTKDVPESKLEEIISYYKNEISQGVLAGKSEEEIINGFGDLKLIISNINNDYSKIDADSSLTTNSIIENNITTEVELSNDLLKTSRNNVSNINLTYDINSSQRINKYFKIIVTLLIMAITIPILALISTLVISLLALSLGILIGSTSLIIKNLFFNFSANPNLPLFIANFPKHALIFFSLGSASLSGLSILFLMHLSKFLFMFIGKFLTKYKRKGGA